MWRAQLNEFLCMITAGAPDRKPFVDRVLGYIPNEQLGFLV